MRILGATLGIALLLAAAAQSTAQQNRNVAIVGHDSLGSKCVGAPSTDLKSGIGVVMSQCDHGPNQTFALAPATAELRISDLCLDAFRQQGGAGQAGDAVGLSTCHGGQNQQWKLKRQGHGPGSRS